MSFEAPRRAPTFKTTLWERAILVLFDIDEPLARRVQGATVDLTDGTLTFEGPHLSPEETTRIKLAIREAYAELGQDLAAILKADPAWPTIAARESVEVSGVVLKVPEHAPEAPDDTRLAEELLKNVEALRAELRERETAAASEAGIAPDELKAAHRLQDLNRYRDAILDRLTATDFEDHDHAADLLVAMAREVRDVYVHRTTTRPNKDMTRDAVVTLMAAAYTLSERLTS